MPVTEAQRYLVKLLHDSIQAVFAARKNGHNNAVCAQSQRNSASDSRRAAWARTKEPLSSPAAGYILPVGCYQGRTAHSGAGVLHLAKPEDALVLYNIVSNAEIFQRRSL